MIKFILNTFLLGMLTLGCIAGSVNTKSNKDLAVRNNNTKDPQRKKHLKQLKKIVFIAGRCSHGPGEHEMYAGCMLLADELQKSMPNTFETVIYHGTWPTDEKAFDNVAAIVIYVDGGSAHLVLPHLDQVNALMKKGVGLACLHYAVEIPKGVGGESFLDWLGGYFETNWSVNPVWVADYQLFPNHEITRGLKPFAIKDEWYYHMRFRENMQRVTPLLIAIPPASTLNRKDGPHENNEFVRAEIGNPQITSWATERPDGGRGFSFTGGHYHHNWIDDNVRKLVLNGIAWITKVKIPHNGLTSPTPTEAELKLNLDDKPCSVKK